MIEVYKSLSFDETAAQYIALSGEPLLPSLILRLKNKNITLASAESCTGGLVGKLLTDVAGASAVYLGGIICYTNKIKTDILGVSENTISEHTEVSAECAGEMATCVRKKFGADIGVSATGFAGPGGGNENDPVGTVYVSASTKDKTYTLRILFDADMSRAQIRTASAYIIFGLIDRIIREKS